AFGDAFVDTLARQLDAAAVDRARNRQEPQQLAVATADVKHLSPALDHLGDEYQVNAGSAGIAGDISRGESGFFQLCHRAPCKPRAALASSRKSRTIANSSGSSSKKAS